jgi:phosphoribosyl-ATP pyrophosphohydrolase
MSPSLCLEEEIGESRKYKENRIKRILRKIEKSLEKSVQKKIGEEAREVRSV